MTELIVDILLFVEVFQGVQIRILQSFSPISKYRSATQVNETLGIQVVITRVLRLTQVLWLFCLVLLQRLLGVTSSFSSILVKQRRKAALGVESFDILKVSDCPCHLRGLSVSLPLLTLASLGVVLAMASFGDGLSQAVVRSALEQVTKVHIDVFRFIFKVSRNF